MPYSVKGKPDGIRCIGEHASLGSGHQSMVRYRKRLINQQEVISGKGKTISVYTSYSKCIAEKACNVFLYLEFTKGRTIISRESGTRRKKSFLT
jgi:hypothetical protein